MSPSTTGVTAFWTQGVVNGIFQRSSPLSAETPDEERLGEGHDLPHAAERGHDRRRVGRPVALPGPADGARRRVEGRERAPAGPADVHDHAAGVDDGGEGGAVERGGLAELRARLLSPGEPPGRGVEGGEDPADSEA